MKEVLSINGQSYTWKSQKMYDVLMGCYPGETGFRNNSNRSQKILAMLYTAFPGLCPHEFLAINLFGIDDQYARRAVWTEMERTRRTLKASNLHEQVAIYTVEGQGYFLSPKLSETEALTLSDGQQLFVKGDELVPKLN